MAANLVKFIRGTQAQFSALETKDADAFYLITDTHRIYLGDTPYSGGIYQTVTELPATGALNTLYFNTTDQSLSYFDGTQFVTIGSNAAVTDLAKKVATIQGDATTEGSIQKALADAKAYADTKASDAQSAAEATAATANTELETKLQGNIDKKADAATTLEGYGIKADAARTELDIYSKGETDTAISSAVANAHHLKRSIVDALPEVSAADEDTIYMVPQNGATKGSETSAYDEFMIVNGAFERIGTSTVDLTDYATKEYADGKASDAQTAATTAAAADATSKANTALADAKSYADGLASNYDAAGAATTAEKNAKDYADGLATNYATAAQGAKADTSLQGVVAGTNIAVVTTDAADVTVDATHPKISVTGLGTAAFKAESDFATAADGALAKSAVQSVTVTAESGTDGTITVDGTEVAVKGLKSMAYQDASDFATADDGALAKTALQQKDVVTGTTDGSISVKGTDVAVKGLGSAAFTSADAYATAADGKKAQTAVQSVATGTTNGTVAVDGKDVSVFGLGSAAYTESSAYATAADGALAQTALQKITLTAGDHVALTNNNSANVTVGVTGVATSDQGQKGEDAYNALTWGTIE